MDDKSFKVFKLFIKELKEEINTLKTYIKTSFDTLFSAI